jgi:hypothetical protein
MSKRLKSSDLVDLGSLISHLKLTLDFSKMRFISVKDLRSIMKVHLVVFKKEEGDNYAENKKF